MCGVECQILLLVTYLTFAFFVIVLIYFDQYSTLYCTLARDACHFERHSVILFAKKLNLLLHLNLLIALWHYLSYIVLYCTPESVIVICSCSYCLETCVVMI